MLTPGVLTYGSGFATWSPTNKSSNIVLSNGNLTASGSTSAGTGIATVGKTFGKWYCEGTITTKTNNTPIFGIASFVPNSANAQPLGFNTSGYGWRGTTWCVTNGVNQLGSCSTAQAAGQIISVALDMDGLTCKFYLNGTLRYTASIAAGIWFPACGSDSASGVIVANFGQSAFTYYSTIDPLGDYNPGFYN